MSRKGVDDEIQALDYARRSPIICGTAVCRGSDSPNKRHVVLTVLSVGLGIAALRHILYLSRITR